MCAFTQEDRTLLVSGGEDGAARIWDPASSAEHAVTHGRSGELRAVCTFTLDGHILLVSSGDDGVVRIWDPATGTEHTVMHSQRGGVRAGARLHGAWPDLAG